mgnify:CR=1 FL=1
MAGEIPNLEVLPRTGTGKGAARQARRDGMVPGVVYGGGVDPLPIQIPFNVLFKRLKAGRFLSTLFNLKVEGHEDVRVICRDVQRDVVKDLPTHLDLMRLRRTSKINLFFPVEIFPLIKCFENFSDTKSLAIFSMVTISDAFKYLPTYGLYNSSKVSCTTVPKVLCAMVSSTSWQLVAKKMKEVINRQRERVAFRIGSSNFAGQ